jgi:CheY-like chemotaxis protein
MNIHEVLEHVLQLIAVEAGERLVLLRDYDPSLPELHGDRSQLIQALLNILRNALEATVTAPLRITLRTRSQRQFTIGEKRHRLVCRIDVIDNGPGIPPELRETLFMPMVSGRAEGTGLGLSIAQSIVHRHGGLLTCESRARRTCFSIFLPMEPDMRSTGSVWVVDDDQSIRWVLERALSQAGIAAGVLRRRGSMLRRLAREQPDVVISDIRMPGIDGLELLRRIREEHPDMPVIITTAHSDLDSAVASYQQGAFEYLPKPFDIDEVVAVTERALAQARENSRSGVRCERYALEPVPEIIGEAPAMQEVFRAIGRLAQQQHHGAHQRRVGHRQGTGRPRPAPTQPARRRSRSSP